MRAALPLVLVAACGSSAAPTASTTTKPTPADTHEDWRSYLARIAGPSCPWIPESSFLVCKLGLEGTFSLIGWEPNNRRYVFWLADRAGNVNVVPGTTTANGWTFEGTELRIAILQEASGWAIHATSAGGDTVFDAQLATDGAGPPAAVTAVGAADMDWRSALHPTTGVWTFTGTARGGEAATYVETCQWIAASTFVACKITGGPGLTLMGWEAHNRRFAHYDISSKGVPTLLLGTLTGKDWLFSNATTRVALTRKSPIEYAIRGEDKVGDGPWQVTFEGSYTTTAEGESTP